MTHTYAVLQVSREAYEEIRRLLQQARYDHAFIGKDALDPYEVIDMHGLALQRRPEESPRG